MQRILEIAIYILLLALRNQSVFGANCSVGDSYTSSGCVKCPIGKYSFEHGGKCQICPDNSDACFGSTIISSDGFWRATNISTNLQRCILPAGCASTNLTGIAACSRGYTDFGCSSCLEGLALNIGSSSCDTCEARDMAYAAIVVSLGLIAVAFLCTQHSAIRSSFRTNDLLLKASKNQDHFHLLGNDIVGPQESRRRENFYIERSPTGQSQSVRCCSLDVGAKYRCSKERQKSQIILQPSLVDNSHTVSKVHRRSRNDARYDSSTESEDSSFSENERRRKADRRYRKKKIKEKDARKGRKKRRRNSQNSNITCSRLACLFCCPGIAIPFYFVSTLLNNDKENRSRKKRSRKDSSSDDGDDDENEWSSPSSLPLCSNDQYCRPWQLSKEPTVKLSWFFALKTLIFNLQLLSLIPWLLNINFMSSSPFLRFLGLFTFSSFRQLPFQCAFSKADYIISSSLFFLLMLSSWIGVFSYYRSTREPWCSQLFNLMSFFLYTNLSLHFVDGSVCMDKYTGVSYFLPALFGGNLSNLVMKYDPSIACSLEKYQLFEMLSAIILLLFSFGFPCFLYAMSHLTPKRMIKFSASSADIFQLVQVFVMVVLLRLGTMNLSRAQRCVVYSIISSLIYSAQSYFRPEDFSCLHQCFSYWLQFNIISGLFFEIQIVSKGFERFILVVNVFFLAYTVLMFLFSVRGFYLTFKPLNESTTEIGIVNEDATPQSTQNASKETQEDTDELTSKVKTLKGYAKLNNSNQLQTLTAHTNMIEDEKEGEKEDENVFFEYFNSASVIKGSSHNSQYVSKIFKGDISDEEHSPELQLTLVRLEPRDLLNL